MSGIVDVFTTEVVNVMLIHFRVLIGGFVGMVLVEIIVVLEIVEFLTIVGFKINLVVVEFKLKVGISTVVNVTSNEFTGIVIGFGVVVFVKLNVEIEVLIEVEVELATIFGVIVDTVDVATLEFCVRWLFSSMSIDGVVVISSSTLLSDDSSVNGVVVISVSVNSPKKIIEN